ncbi:unnamed protein product [Rotaria sp. Silwood2]|nr:unnamed protein product [Rotaria sp. Silwood2]
MLNQEEIHRYFNHLTGAKRIEFLYGLLHLCQPLELRYLGTCLEEIARKDYEYLYHAEQKTNHLSTPTISSSSTSSVSSNNEQANQQTDLLSDEKLDLTDQFTRAHAIVDIALLWAKNRACAIRLFRRLKASESVKLVDMLLERDDLDERAMDEILIIFCLAVNHPAFSFDMRTQMSQIFKELEKRQRKMKLLQTVHNNINDDDTLDQSTCLGYHISSSSMHNTSTLSVHASPLLTRLSVVNFDTDSTSIRVLIRADWSDNNSTLTWKTPNDIRSFHLQKLERQQQSPTYQHKPPRTGTNKPINSSTAGQQLNDAFNRYDIIETSLHFNVKRLDLHMMADADILVDRLVENGSLQMTIANLSIDLYPYHEYGSSKNHWIKYSESQSINRNEWITRLHEEWHAQFNTAKASAPSDETSMKFERALRTKQIYLFESCRVINIDDLVFYPVSLNNDKQQKRRRPLISSDKTYYHLPDNLGIINIQQTEYYYPFSYAFPVPNSDLYIQIMPLVIRVDFSTLSWLDAFVSTLSITIDNSGVLKTDRPPVDLEHVAIKLEAMLPRIVISSDLFSNNRKLQETKQDANSESNTSLQQNEILNQQQFDILELNISKILFTNTRTELTSNRYKLEKHLELFKETNFFQQTQWPFSNETTTRFSSLFEKHPYDTYLYDNPLSKKTNTLPDAPSASTALHTYYTMTTDSLKKVRDSAKYDIWNLNVENIYLDFTPSSSSSDSIRLTKQNMIDTLSMTSWIVLDKVETNSWLNILCILENPSLLKISQKQYTFIMHLVDELGLFFDALERNKNQTHLIKEKLLLNNSSDDIKITICLTMPTTFTLGVMDDLEDPIINHSTPTPSSLSEIDIEPIIHDTSETNVVIDLVTTPAPSLASTTTIEKMIPNKSLDSPRKKKSKFEFNIQRGLEIASKGSRASSISSLMNMSDNSDETSSQWDLNEELDADLEASVFNNDSEEQQQKVTRIELDDDSISVTGKNYIGMRALESANGVFIKLNQINVCITEDNGKIDKQMYIACNVKYLRIDEFSSVKLDTIKPKIFENENPDEYNTENVPPINVRIDFPKSELSPPPIITLHIQDRSLKVASHAIDVISQNFEEMLTSEEKILRENQPIKTAPIDIHLNNVQFTLEPLPEFSTTQTPIAMKPPIKMIIECMHILRQIDGKIIVRKMNNNDDKKQIIPSLPQSTSTDNINEKLQRLEIFRLENERLRSELNTCKTEISVLRSERDSLMNTIAKLDIELTEAECQRLAQQQSRKK